MLAPDLAQARGGGPSSPISIRCAERVEGRRDVAGLLGDDDEMIILAVIGERDAEAVENPPAQRREQPQAHPVLVGEHRVAIRIQDLQLVHPPGDGGEQYRLTAREDRRAPGEQLSPMRFPPHGRRSARAEQGALAAAQQKARDRENRDGQHGAKDAAREDPAIARQAANAAPTGKASPPAGQQREASPYERKRPVRRIVPLAPSTIGAGEQQQTERSRPASPPDSRSWTVPMTKRAAAGNRSGR